MPPKGKGRGKGKGKGNSKKTNNRAPDPNSKETNNRAPEPNSDSICKQEIISNILSRLPVKTLSQFRCVCKQWRKLISKPDFIATHFHRSSSLQCTDSSVIIKTCHDETNHNVLVRYKPPQSLVELDTPYPWFSLDMSIAGPVNGILCIFQPTWGDVLTLWNPATRMSRMVKLSETKTPQDVPYLVSVGLAFDSEKNDLLIVRILCARLLSGRDISEVEFEVRPMKSPLGWKKLKSDFKFYIDRHSCDAIFKGEPYWLAYKTPLLIFGKYEALLRFNVEEMELEWLPLPFAEAGDYNLYPVNFEDSLGLLIWEKRDKCYIDVWITDDEEYDWRKKYKVGPFFGIDRIMGCLRNGDIVAENEDGLLLFYTVTSSELVVQNAECLFPDISIVGPVNGYLCLFQPTWRDMITLWDQPERQSRMVKLSETKYPLEPQYIVSVGLAFDFQKNDLLILRIFCSSTLPKHVEIEILHPMKSPLGWKNLKSNMHFCIDPRYTCDAIFKGEPYWLAYITATSIFGQHEGLVRFDRGKMKFHWLLLPFIRAGYYIKYLVSFEYYLGMLTWEERNKCYIDVWLMDDEKHDWIKKYKVGPFFRIDRFMGCLRNGDFVAEKNSRKLILYDPVTFSVKKRLIFPNGKKGSYEIFDCPESLLLIEGMVAVEPQD